MISSSVMGAEKAMMKIVNIQPIAYIVNPKIIHKTLNTIFLILFAIIPVIAKTRNSNIKNMLPCDNFSQKLYGRLLMPNAMGTNRIIEEIIHQRFFLIVFFMIV